MELKQQRSTSAARGRNRSLVALGPLAPGKSPQQLHRKQLSSFILFISVVIFINLCPFHPELSLFEERETPTKQSVETYAQYTMRTATRPEVGGGQSGQIAKEPSYLEKCVAFVRLVFTNPIRFNRQRSGPSTRSSLQAEARVIGKMAKVWYIKKKIKKLSKKLKKHTIAVPVFTAIPIYEHSYYPQPHVTHVSHAGMHHAAAASSYAPTVATGSQLAAGSQQMAAAASSSHQQMVHPYRPMVAATGSAGHYNHHHHHPGYGPSAGANQIINSYTPSAPLFIDEAGGVFGQFGNAYDGIRYNGGFHMW